MQADYSSPALVVSNHKQSYVWPNVVEGDTVNRLLISSKVASTPTAPQRAVSYSVR